MQTLFRNPLASPWTLGVAAGAQLGVAVAVVVAAATGTNIFSRLQVFGNISLAVAASVGSCLVLLIILSVSRRVSTVTLLILGLMFHYLADGLVTMVLHFTDETQVRVFNSWSDGTYGSVTWSQLHILISAVLAGLVIAHLLVKPLNALLLGENYARTLGLSVAQAKLWTFAGTAILAGSVTAYCGPVIFLGVAVPHLCRGLFQTSDHRVLMPAVTLMGALLALSADLVTHLPWQKHVLHMNAVNAMIGAPIVIWILLRQRNMRSLEL
jgi:iron complex transport system permease protein